MGRFSSYYRLEVLYMTILIIEEDLSFAIVVLEFLEILFDHMMRKNDRRGYLAVGATCRFGLFSRAFSKAFSTRANKGQ